VHEKTKSLAPANTQFPASDLILAKSFNPKIPCVEHDEGSNAFASPRVGKGNIGPSLLDVVIATPRTGLEVG
jgi:hypothetical protein